MKIFAFCLLALSSCVVASINETVAEEDGTNSSSNILLAPPENTNQPNPCTQIETFYGVDGDKFVIEIPVECAAFETPDRGDPPNEMLNPSVQTQVY